LKGLKAKLVVKLAIDCRIALEAPSPRLSKCASHVYGMMSIDRAEATARNETISTRAGCETSGASLLVYSEVSEYVPEKAVAVLSCSDALMLFDGRTIPRCEYPEWPTRKFSRLVITVQYAIIAVRVR
jgi:hypothetical protein